MDTKSFYGGRKYTRVTTIGEAHEAVENASHPVNVVVLPPAAGDIGTQESDTEDANDDPEEAYEPAGELEIEEEIESDDNFEIEQQPKRKRKETPNWKKCIEFDKSLLCGDKDITETVMEMEGKSVYEIWEKIFTPEMLKHIVLETNRYANRECNNPNFRVSEKDIRNFLGIVLLSGYHTLPEEHHYWSTQPDLGVPIVSSTMSKNRYLEIKRYIHFADNQNLTVGNKMSKISPLYDMLNDSLISAGIFHEMLSIDESMVPYFGRHSCKMFIRGKPIRFGYKIWCLCGNDGYPYHLKIYQGKETNAMKQPLGTRVVMEKVDIIACKSSVTCHQLYFDNFFTSYDLMTELANRKMKATGTVRENRTAGATKAITSTKDLQKKGRGTYDYCSDGKVYVAKWNDNSVFAVASNWETHNPIHKVKRRVKGGEKEVTQPHLINSYNKGMGGVDLMDRLSETYRPTIRGKKWYWPLFVNLINVVMIAAWRIHCQVEPAKLSHLEFRRHVTLCLLKVDIAHPPRPSSTAALPGEVRYDGINHMLGTTTQGRCKVCQKNTKNMCKKCGVRLHTERGKQCFEMYHSK